MPDYMFLLESRLSPEQRAVMLRVQELSAALGFNVYLTGGTVRDLVTGASLRDLDFTAEGNPSKIAHELEKGGAKILHEDEKFRHVELLFAGDCEGSISAARDDHYVRPGTRAERPAVVLTPWEAHYLLEAVNPVLAKKHPSYDAIARLMKVREDLFTAGFRPRLASPMLLAILGKLKDRELANVLSKAGFRSAEVEAALGFEEEALEAQKELLGRKMNAPVDAFRFLEKMPLDQIAYLMAESNKSAALSKIRAFLNKWRPIRNALPVVATELEALGMVRGPKFDAIVEQVFAMQLTGRGKTKEEREKILRKLSGIKEQPKKKEKEKKAKGTDKAHAAAAMGDAAHKKHAAAKAEAKQAAKGKPVPAKAHAKHIARAPRGKSASSGKKSHGRR